MYQQVPTTVRIACCLAGIVLCGVPSSASAADWPMWRHDAQRSGTTPEELAEQLHLEWVRTLPPPRVAWPNEPRLHFDASYEPVVMGKRMFVGSMVDGSVSAYDTDSGAELWKFYTEGPVRFAPVAQRGRVYVGSDDGFLYCLDAEAGELRWKVRGTPADRPDYRHLGNARLISFWPVRGGPVLADGVVYFGAGIWPTLGVFIGAVDAETGARKWLNGNTNYLEKVRIDHNELHEAGLSPQGYCLLSDGKLVVPNGRSMPARFDPETGKMLYYVQGYRNGDARVTATDRFLFVGARGVVDVKDGREVGNRWVAAGKDAPAGWDGGKRDLFEGPFYDYKFMHGCDYRSVFQQGIAYGAESGFLYAYDVNRPAISLYEKKVDGQAIHPARWDAPPVWDRYFLAKGDRGSTRVTVKAGSRLYTHVDTTLFAVRLAGTGEDSDKPNEPGQPTTVWKHELDTVPSSMLVAAGKLFVVLADGRICCFGKEAVEAKTYPPKHEPLVRREDKWAQTVEKILEVSRATEGYAVVLGLESGRLVEALLSRSNLRVIAVDADAEKVRALGDRFVRAGIYATRVEAFVGDPASFHIPPYLASLITSELSGPANPLEGMPAERLFEMVRPYGGVACFAASVQRQETLVARIGSARLAGAEVEAIDGTVTLRRSGALPGAADWTHECSDAARTFFSRDERVKAPLAILWYGDGADHGFQKYKDYGRGVKPQVSCGRLFAFDDRTQQLTAIDIYTGRLLWRHDTDTSLVRFVSMPDGVYVASGLKCDLLDPASGTRRHSFVCDIAAEADRIPGVVAVRAADDLLLIAIGFDLPTGHSHQAIESGLWDAEVLVALDRATGRQLWSKRAETRLNLHAIAAGSGLVFCTDSMAPLEADELARRGAAPDTFPSTTTALDARTGEVRWQKTYRYGYRAMTGRGPLAIRPYDDWLAYSETHGLLLIGKLSEARALSARSGEEVWNSPTAGRQPLILAADSLINQAGQRYDLLSGKPLTQAPLFQRGGCNYAVGGKNLLFVRAKCAAYIDLESQKEYSLRNVRSGCSNSLVAAGGLLNAPCYSTGCVCNYPLQTSFSMFSMLESAAWSRATPLVLPEQ